MPASFDRGTFIRKIMNKAKSYVGVLSFLLLHDYWGRVSLFMERDYTDQRLSNFDSISVATLDQKQPILGNEIKDILSVKLGLGPKACKDFFQFLYALVHLRDTACF
jgi:hypothetical protein